MFTLSPFSGCWKKNERVKIKETVRNVWSKEILFFFLWTKPRLQPKILTRIVWPKGAERMLERQILFWMIRLDWSALGWTLMLLLFAVEFLRQLQSKREESNVPTGPKSFIYLLAGPIVHGGCVFSPSIPTRHASTTIFAPRNHGQVWKCGLDDEKSSVRVVRSPGKWNRLQKKTLCFAAGRNKGFALTTGSNALCQ